MIAEFQQIKIQEAQLNLISGRWNNVWHKYTPKYILYLMCQPTPGTEAEPQARLPLQSQPPAQ